MEVVLVGDYLDATAETVRINTKVQCADRKALEELKKIRAANLELISSLQDSIDTIVSHRGTYQGLQATDCGSQENRERMLYISLAKPLASKLKVGPIDNDLLPYTHPQNLGHYLDDNVDLGRWRKMYQHRQEHEEKTGWLYRWFTAENTQIPCLGAGYNKDRSECAKLQAADWTAERPTYRL